MALTFPISPSNGQVASVAGSNFVYDGVAWKRTGLAQTLKTVAGQSLVGNGNISFNKSDVGLDNVPNLPSSQMGEYLISIDSRAPGSTLPLQYTTNRGVYSLTYDAQGLKIISYTLNGGSVKNLTYDVTGLLTGEQA